MKRIVALFFAIFFATAAFGQENENPEWLLVVDDLDLVSLYQQGSTLISNGYVPVAMGISDDNLVHLIFTAQLDLGIEAWMIDVFSDPAELNPSINEHVDRGWIPVDVALQGEDLAVLLIRGDVTVRNWGLAQESPDVGEIQRLTEAAAEEGLLLFGITDGPGLLWYLFVETSRPLFNSLVVAKMPVNEFFDRTNARAADDYIPWSLFFRGSEVFVQYVR